jgi:hypothetical protein
VLAALARAGDAPGPEIALDKIALSNNMKRLAEFVAAVLGPALIADTGARGVPTRGLRRCLARRGTGWAAALMRS